LSVFTFFFFFFISNFLLFSLSILCSFIFELEF
jgi:hypothetical protein